MGDFSFQTGEWRVHHRKLSARLVGAETWLTFSGTCRAFEVMAGEANVEDQFLDDPTGPYRATTFRRRSPQTGMWSIWWHDGRFGHLDPPVQGGFQDGVGRFFAEDRLDGRPIQVRFLWSDITSASARWRQAFSADGGATWETNWIMDFERVG